ncbi:hypothetical protein [Kribbella capetownensis]|uniref:hypothetical protein n=1 Tax=Kribbella capetownensis TaxID=1572659 RepID=UPI001EE12C95|nr:hypothetical protein [Kribbella capetownensis]
MPHFRSQETVDSALRMSDEGVPDRVNAEIHGVAIKDPALAAAVPAAGSAAWHRVSGDAVPALRRR